MKISVFRGRICYKPAEILWLTPLHWRNRISLWIPHSQMGYTETTFWLEQAGGRCSPIACKSAFFSRKEHLIWMFRYALRASTRILSFFLFFFLLKDSMLTMVSRTNVSPGSRLFCHLESLQKFQFFCLTDMKLWVVPTDLFYFIGMFQGLLPIILCYFYNSLRSWYFFVIVVVSWMTAFWLI